MATLINATEVSLSEVTLCVPCDQGAAHPESHAAGTRIVLMDRCPPDAPDDLPVSALVYAARTGCGVAGPVTVHKGPVCDFDAATGAPVREWALTQP